MVHAIEATAGQTLKDLERSDVLAALAQHGAVLLRGFEPSVFDFFEQGQRLSDRLLVDPSPDRHSQPEAEEIQTAEAGRHTVALHFEYGHTPFRPDLAWRDLGLRRWCPARESL